MAPESEIPEPVRRLLLESIDTVPQLEAILLLREHRDRGWTVQEAGERLYVSPTVAAHTLSCLTERGFFEQHGDTWRYRPASPALESDVDALAATYARHVVAVTQLIHAKPGASLRHFADAFRLRRDK